MSGTLAVVSTIGFVALGLSLMLLLAFRFERFVGLRYLARSRPSGVARAGLLVTLALIGLGVGVLLAGRGRSRELETAGVVIILLAGLGSFLFALLCVFSVFTTVSTIGVVLGVASLVVVLAVTSGFEREFREKVLVVNAHLLVMEYGEPTLEEREKKAEEYMRKLRDLPELTGMSKFSLSAGEVMIGKVGAQVKGIDLAKSAGELERVRASGKVADLGRPARCDGQAPASDEWVGRIFLGAELARKLRVRLGQCISVMAPFSGGDPTAPPVGSRFEVVGTFQMGFHEYDTRLAYVSLEDARRMGGSSATLFGIELRFRDPDRAMTIVPEVEARIGHDAKLLDWQTLNHNTFTALQMQ
jgi:lipoprotein-releasing system permease protein